MSLVTETKKNDFFFLFAVDHPWTALYMTIEAFNEELMRLSELLVIHIHFTSNKSNDGLNISHSRSFFFISRRWSMITTFIQVFSRAPLFHRSHWFPCDIFRSTRCIQCETTFLQLFDGNIEIKNFFPFPFHFQYGNTAIIKLTSDAAKITSRRVCVCVYEMQTISNIHLSLTRG